MRMSGLRVDSCGHQTEHQGPPRRPSLLFIPQIASGRASDVSQKNLRPLASRLCQLAILSPFSVAFPASAVAGTSQLVIDGPIGAPPSWEIWAGFLAGVIPFFIASVEFGKRILIQRRCQACSGSGLVQRGKYLRKCTQCGGLLPWLGWRAFWFSNLNPGNGGPLLQPKGQRDVLYQVPPRQPPLEITRNEPSTTEEPDNRRS